MKSKVLFLSILVSSLILVNISYATLTVSVSLPTKSLTENEQVTATVTVSNAQGSDTESNIVTSLSSSTSWFSEVAACSSISSLSGGASGTSTCIIKPTSTGSDLTLTATSQSQGGTTGSGSTSGINVASQSSSLTASTSGDSSVAASSIFYVGVTVTAPSANDVVNARATISESGKCTVDTSYVSATQTLGNITKGTSKSPTNWKLTAASSSGTCAVTVNIVSDSGGSASPSKSITVGGGSGDTGGTSGSGITGYSVLLTVSGTGLLPKVTTEKGRALITLPSIATGKFVAVDIKKTEELSFRKITVYAKNSVENVQVTVTKLADKPASVTQEITGRVYNYVQVDKNISDININKTTIQFEVEKSWISSNNIDESTIALYRYDSNAWNKLESTKLSEDKDSISYEAISPGLSVFAISGEVTAGEQPSAEKPAEEKKPVEEFVESVKRDTWKIALIITVVILATAASVYWFRKKSLPATAKPVRR